MYFTMNEERVHRIYLQFENLPRSIFSMLIFIQHTYNFHGVNFTYYSNMQQHQLVYCIETYHVILKGLCPRPPSKNTPVIFFTYYFLGHEKSVNFFSLNFATKFSLNTAGQDQINHCLHLSGQFIYF